MAPGRERSGFQWNAWGWFGGQVGSTLWMLLVAVFSSEASGASRALMTACFLASNIVGVCLWRKRRSISPGAAIQILLLLLFISTAAAFAGADLLGTLDLLEPRLKNPRSIYWLLLIFPRLMTIMHIGSHAGRDI